MLVVLIKIAIHTKLKQEFVIPVVTKEEQFVCK
jgi:hypothetical protein